MPKTLIYGRFDLGVERAVDLAALHAFNRSYGRWLELRSQLELDDPSLSEVRKQAICDEMAELELTLMLQPAPSPLVIWRKFEIFRHINDDEQIEFVDHRQRVFLMAIEADCRAWIKFSGG